MHQIVTAGVGHERDLLRLRGVSLPAPTIPMLKLCCSLVCLPFNLTETDATCAGFCAGSAAPPALARGWVAKLLKVSSVPQAGTSAAVKICLLLRDVRKFRNGLHMD